MKPPPQPEEAVFSDAAPQKWRKQVKQKKRGNNSTTICRLVISHACISKLTVCGLRSRAGLRYFSVFCFVLYVYYSRSGGPGKEFFSGRQLRIRCTHRSIRFVSDTLHTIRIRSFWKRRKTLGTETAAGAKFGLIDSSGYVTSVLVLVARGAAFCISCCRMLISL